MEIITIAGIDLKQIADEPYHLLAKGWHVYAFRVLGPGYVLRADLSRLVGEIWNGKRIEDVESFAVERQTGREIGLAVKAQNDNKTR